MYRLTFTLLSLIVSGLAPISHAQSTAQDSSNVVLGMTLESALHKALTGNPNVLTATTQVQSALASVQSQEGTFDLALTAQAGYTDTRSPVSISSQNVTTSNAISQQAGLSKLLKNGMQMDLSASQTSSTSQTDGSEASARSGSGTLTFQLRVPLVRNRGGEVSNPLKSTEIEAQATRSDLELTISQTILDTCLAYWDTVAKTQQLMVARGSEERSRKQLEDTRKLIAADQLPRADINLAQANLSDRGLARSAAEQALLESKLRLARVLGLNAQASLTIGDPIDTFPQVFPSPDLVLARKDTLIARALEGRNDLVSLRLRRESALLSLANATNAMRPQVDLVLGVTQNGISESAPPFAVGSGFGRIAGPGMSAQLLAQFPLANNAAKGSYKQVMASLEAQETRLAELGYAISNRIEASTNALVRAAERLKQAQSSVETYALGLENERTKRRMGLATMIDILNLEDRYNQALLSVVLERQAFSTAVVQLRFETGTLLQRDGDKYAARLSDLLAAEF